MNNSMGNQEIVVTKDREVIELIRSFDNGNTEMVSVARQLADILERIPKESIGEIYAKITEDNLLKMGIRHHNDRFRLVQLLIGNTVVGVTTCMMKDTLNFQLEHGNSFRSLEEMATPYFETVFGNSFAKIITKSNGGLVKCEMKFDDERFSNRLYTSDEENRSIDVNEEDVQRFRYLSFFEVYDYFVKNEIIEQPNAKKPTEMIELNQLSGVGFGCHFINTLDVEHEQAINAALDSKCKIIDTSSNYQQGMAEELLGRVLKNRDRSTYFLISKGGSLSGNLLTRFNQSIKGDVPEDELVQISSGHFHCIHPKFLESQLEHSLIVMNQSFLDGYFLHNPEYYLESADSNLEEFYRRITNAFIFLEEQVEKGKIRYYGISESSGKVDLEMLFQIAKDISPEHHFRLIQFPYNVAQKPILNGPNGKKSIDLIKENGAIAFGNRPLTARRDGKSFRLVGRSLHEIQKNQVLEAMDNAFYALEQYAESLPEPIDISESSIIQYIYGSWENFTDDTTFDAIVHRYLTPYLRQISKGEIDENVSREMTKFTDTLTKYLQDMVTKRSSELMTKLGYQETYENPNGVLDLCQEYMDDGIDVVLCGMKRVKYVDQLSQLF